MKIEKMGASFKLDMNELGEIISEKKTVKREYDTLKRIQKNGLRELRAFLTEKIGEERADTVIKTYLNNSHLVDEIFLGKSLLDEGYEVHFMNTVNIKKALEEHRKKKEEEDRKREIIEEVFKEDKPEKDLEEEYRERVLDDIIKILNEAPVEEPVEKTKEDLIRKFKEEEISKKIYNFPEEMMDIISNRLKEIGLKDEVCYLVRIEPGEDETRIEMVLKKKDKEVD